MMGVCESSTPSIERHGRESGMELLQFIFNVAVALLMGLAIGLERQIHQHVAGLRTNALVCVGAALFVSCPG